MRSTGLVAFPLTPTDADGRVDVTALRKLVAPLCAAGVDAVGLLGSTGTYAYLSRAERRRALDAALDEAAGRTPILVGVGAMRTDAAVRLAQDASQAGAAAGLLAPLSYTPLTDDEVFAHFRTVAGEGGLPLCIYDNPATTHFQFPAALIARLAQLDGIVAIKQPAPAPVDLGGYPGELRGLLPEGFSIGCSGDWHAVDAMIAGADAWHSVLAGLFPQTCMDLTRAARDGRPEEARRLNARLAPLWALFRELSSLRVIYACADILDICRTAPPRPILPLGSADTQRVALVLGGLGLR